MAKLAAVKSKEENGIVHEYWQKFFLDQFCLDLKLTNLKKVLKAARKVGIIKLISKLGRSNVYQPGSLFPNSFCSILLVVKKDHHTTKELVEMENKVNEIHDSESGLAIVERQSVHTPGSFIGGIIAQRGAAEEMLKKSQGNIPMVHCPFWSGKKGRYSLIPSVLYY